MRTTDQATSSHQRPIGIADLDPGALRLLEREDFKAFVDAHQTELRNYSMFAGASQIMAALRRENERVLRSRDYSAEEKSRRIHENNERIRSVARAVVQRSAEPTLNQREIRK